MPELLGDYLPLVIFIGVALFIAARAAGRAVHRRLFRGPIRRSCRPMSAASTPSTTRA